VPLFVILVICYCYLFIVTLYRFF